MTSDSDTEMGEIKSANPNRYVFDWEVIQADIIWERVHCRSLNIWILSVAIFLVISIFSLVDTAELNVPSVLASAVSYGIYLVVGMCFCFVVAPLTLVNAPGAKQLDWKVMMLIMYAIGSMGTMSFVWTKDLKNNNLTAFAIWIVGLLCCLGLLRNVLWDFVVDHKESYVEIAQKRNESYVRSLFRKAGEARATHAATDNLINEPAARLPLRLHPVFDKEGNDIVKVAPNIRTLTSDIFVLPEKVGMVNHTNTGHVSTVSHDASGSVDNEEAAATSDKKDSDKSKSTEEAKLRKFDKERSLNEFFKEVHWKDMAKDAYDNTPTIMRLGVVLGVLCIIVFALASAGLFEIKTTWAYLYDWYLEKTEDIRAYTESASDFQASIENLYNITGNYPADDDITTNTTNYNITEVAIKVTELLDALGYNVTTSDAYALIEAVEDVKESAEALFDTGEDFTEWWDHFNHQLLGYEDDYDIFKDTWNITLYVGVSLAALVSLIAVLWPVVVAMNTRANLRTGAWRNNSAAYAQNPQVYVLSGVPGMFIGNVVMASIVYVVLLTLLLFCFTYNPLRELLYQYFGGFLVATLLGMLVVMLINRVFFGGTALDKDGNIKNFNRYSRFFAVMLFFNLLYGTLSAIIRFGFFVGYALVGVLRVDATLLPTPLWSMDSFLGMYNSLLFFEHQINNPILRSAVVLFTQTTVSHNSRRRARNRWWLAYTLIKNPSIICLRRRETNPDNVLIDKTHLDSFDARSQVTSVDSNVENMYGLSSTVKSLENPLLSPYEQPS